MNIISLKCFIVFTFFHILIESYPGLPTRNPVELKKEMKEYETIRPLSESLSEYEKQLIHDAIIAINWNQSKSARILKTTEQTLRYKMSQLGISRKTE